MSNLNLDNMIYIGTKGRTIGDRIYLTYEDGDYHAKFRDEIIAAVGLKLAVWLNEDPISILRRMVKEYFDSKDVALKLSKGTAVST